MKDKTDSWKTDCSDGSNLVVEPSLLDSYNTEQDTASTADKGSLKRSNNRISEISPADGPNKKRVKVSAASNIETHPSADHLVPVGCQWGDNSCAYDTVIALLYNAWLDKPSSVLAFPELSNNLFPAIAELFDQMYSLDVPVVRSTYPIVVLLVTAPLLYLLLMPAFLCRWKAPPVPLWKPGVLAKGQKHADCTSIEVGRYGCMMINACNCCYVHPVPKGPH
ncbi:hypothetical protein BDN71DRAFT_1432899 [Pleurotus eryngii]|uniref:Uncharacterized protein n=1 Tax=Pleurotus eryngii TaxID=5323 RepID=A0A9P5ZV09_PLEER|nr:hypothetical protein BDN71DRAFT_1432899 [Pleurotus eryngii]